jgi:hypothetical protein
MYVPPSAPILAGQTLQMLEIPPIRADSAGTIGRAERLVEPLEAVVIRVDRQSFASAGQVGVAVQFSQTLA